MPASKSNSPVIYLLILVVVNLFGLVLQEADLRLDFAQLNILVIFSFLLYEVYKGIIVRRENRIIKYALGKYINEEILKEILKDPDRVKLGGELKHMTVIFSDVRDFSVISEDIKPEELVSLTNEYLEQMSEVIFKHNGTIDKFFGDAIVAFWNAPLANDRHQLDAIRCALEMQRKLYEFNAKVPKEMQFQMGIGINTGEMVVGNVGSQRRYQYTVLGDSVNLASRLESLTKKYRVKIILTDLVLRGIKLPKDIIIRQLDEVIVRGKTAPAKIYQPMYRTPETIALKQQYEKALQYYQQGDFRSAGKIFSQIKGDYPSKLLNSRLERLVTKKDWQGIWQWQQK
ncbi:MAG TPA: adenylate/guanylate cyclase domain-containing protein [Candidatus Dojkabacteria bacterium]|nr:adenylate/guanylate cyclase domain-containing protein [Candidatus Dojkabacteria bacterium]